jgi:hypothetical protein
MSDIKKRLLEFLGLVNVVKSHNLDWQVNNQAQLLDLSKQKALAKKQLTIELTKKNAELAHDLELLKARQAAQLTLLKTRCAEDIKDYREYLIALEQLKTLTKNSFSYLPEPIALTIYHHAKTLLNQMWEADDFDEKIKLEAELLKFLTTVTEEAQVCDRPTTAKSLPENTLKLIKSDSL